MRFWFDTEFHERGGDFPVELISIGIVAEDGREFSAVSDDFNLTLAKENLWLADNVLPHLPDQRFWLPRRVIADDIRHFVGDAPEFWAYYADYDWVVLCQLYGSMVRLPDTWPMWCRDVKQLCWSMGDPHLPEPLGVQHDALEDAKDCKRKWEYLQQLAAYEEGVPE